MNADEATSRIVRIRRDGTVRAVGQMEDGSNDAIAVVDELVATTLAALYETRRTPAEVVEDIDALRSAEEILTTVESMGRAIFVLDGAVRELDRFGLPVLAGGGDRAPRTPSEVRKRWRSWGKSRSRELAGKCTGVAIVTMSLARRALIRLAEPAIRRTFHAAAQPFEDEPSARAWLSARVTEAARAR